MRICFFPLAQQSFKSMAKMKKLGPEMQRLKEQYGDDCRYAKRNDGFI